MALWEGEHALMRQINQARTIVVLLLVLLNELLQVDSLLGDVLGALLVGLEAESVSTLVHIHGAEPEAEDIELAGLTRALAIAFTIDHLFIVVALCDDF